MRDHCAEHGVKYLAMPRIGCGLDRLEWRDVKPKIEEIFSPLDISITVYNFNQVNYVLKPECCSVLHILYDVMDECTVFVLPTGVNRWHVWASSHMRRLNINMSRPKIFLGGWLMYKKW
jgi:hypothetical protein